MSEPRTKKCWPKQWIEAAQHAGFADDQGDGEFVFMDARTADMLADFAGSIAEHAENEQREEYAAQDAELARMRERIERLRGLCKSLVGMLRDAGGQEWIAEADICQALIGDMEPPLDGINTGSTHHARF